MEGPAVQFAWDQEVSWISSLKTETVLGKLRWLVSLPNCNNNYNSKCDSK